MAERTVGLRIQLDGVTQTVSSIKDLETELVKAKEKLNGLTIGSADFRKLSTEIARTEGTLGNLRKNAEGITFEKQIESFGKFTGGVTAAFATATAAAQLFGSNTEGIAEAAAQAQNVLAIAISARSVAEGIGATKTVVLTVATQAQTLANNLAKISFNQLTAAMLANPIGIVAAALGALVIGLAYFSSETKKARTVQDDINDSMQVGVDKIINQKINLESLSRVVLDLTQKESVRNLALKELQKLMPSLNGLTLKSLNLSGLLKIATEQYTQSLINKAQVENLVNLYTKESIRLEEIKKTRVYEATGAVTAAWLKLRGQVTGNIQTQEDLNKELEKGAKNLTEIKNKINELNDPLIQNGLNEQDLAKKTQDALDSKERGKNAAIANEKRRTELINGELSRRLAELKDAYKQEREEAIKNGQDITLIDKLYFRNRKQAIDDYRNEYLKLVNDFYIELNNLTTGSYILDETNLKDSQERRKKDTETRQAELLKVAGEAITKQSEKETEASANLLKLKQKESDAYTAMLNKRNEVQMSQTEEEHILLVKQLRDNEAAHDKSTLKRIAAEDNYNKIVKEKSKINTDSIEKEKEQLKEEFLKVNTDQQTLFEAQIKDLKIRRTLEGLKAIDDLNKKSKQDDLQSSLDVYNKEYDLYVDGEKRKLQAKGEIEALAKPENKDKSGEEITAMVQEEVKAYDALFESIRKAGQENIKLQNEATKLQNKKIAQEKEIAALTKTYTDEQLNEQAGYYMFVTDLQEKYKFDVNKTQEENLKNEKTLKQKLINLELVFAQDKLKIEKDLIEKKIAALEKDPTVNPEALKQLKVDLLKVNMDYAKNVNDIDKNTATDADAIAAEALKKRREETNKVLANVRKGVELMASSLSEISSMVAQSFGYQLDRLEKDYQYTLSQVVGDTKQANDKREELEKTYQIQKAKIEKEARISALKYQLLQTIANTASAVMAALGTVPFGPWNIAQAVIVGGLGAAQSLIVGQQLSQAESMARGGLVKGRSHEQGGVRYANGGVTMEGNEAVINRRSTLQYGSLLSQINEQGGGKPIYINSAMDSRLIEVLASQKQAPIRAYVLETDITKSQAINRRLEALASF